MESFPLGDKHILCVASVPGAVGEDYREYEERMAGGAAAGSEGDKRHSVSAWRTGLRERGRHATLGDCMADGDAFGSEGDRRAAEGTSDTW